MVGKLLNLQDKLRIVHKLPGWEILLKEDSSKKLEDRVFQEILSWKVPSGDMEAGKAFIRWCVARIQSERKQAVLMHREDIALLIGRGV